MTQITPPPATLGQPVPVVQTDRPCFYCSYNLTGLPVEGLCPECGKPVLDSLRGVLLQYAAPEYVRTIRSGLSLVLSGILLMVPLWIALPALAFTGLALPPVPLVIAGLGLIPAIMLIVGYYRYTAPDPGYAGKEYPDTARKVARAAVIVLAGAQAVTFSLRFARLGPYALPGIPLSAAMIGVALLSQGVYLVAFVTQFFTILRYTRWLARRVPDVYLEQRCRTYLWLLPLIALVGAVAFLLGPLIALVMYWNLLDRLRKHLRSIVEKGEPAALKRRLI